MSLQIITITDSQSGTTASILPELGCNCFRFAVTVAGQPVEILWADPQVVSGNARPSRSGIPVLFPFPGRIRGTTFLWEGHEYPLEEGDGFGNAIHGFVMRRPWRVTAQSVNRMTAEFHASRDDADLLRRWPADFLIAVTYEVRGRSLWGTYKITNPDSRPLPCGLGTHPYFRVPLGEGLAEECRVTVPLSQMWELNDMHATGHVGPASQAAALTAGIRFAEAQFDNVFSGLAFQDEHFSSLIRDPKSGLTLRQTVDRSFPYCVLYTPPHREAICLEPYSCVPDAFRLARDGIAAGLRILAPGETWTTTIEIALEEM